MLTLHGLSVDRSALMRHTMSGGSTVLEGDKAMAATVEGAGEWLRWALGGGLALTAAIIAWFIKDRANTHEREILRLKADSDAKIREMLERNTADRANLQAEVERTRQASADRESLRREQQVMWNEFDRKLEAIRNAIVSGREATASEVAVLRQDMVRLTARCDSFERRINEMSDDD